MGLMGLMGLGGCSAESDSAGGVLADGQARDIRPEEFLGVVFAGEAPVKASQEKPYRPTDPYALPPLDDDLPQCVRKIYAAMYMNFVIEDDIYNGNATKGNELDGMVFVCHDSTEDKVYYYPPAITLKPAALNASSGVYPPWSVRDEDGHRRSFDTLQGPVLSLNPEDRVRRELMLFVINAGESTLYLQTPNGRISVDDHHFTETRELQVIWRDPEAIARRVLEWFPNRPGRDTSAAEYFRQLQTQQLHGTGEILMLAANETEARRMDEPMRVDIGRTLTQDEIARGTNAARTYGNTGRRQGCHASDHNSPRLTRQATLFLYFPPLEALEDHFGLR
jgi:hypothetical protein